MIPLLSSIPFLVHFSLSVLAAIRLLYRKLAVNTTLAWLFLLFGLPVVGVALYVLFGDHRLGGRRMKMGERLRSFFMQVFSVKDAGIPPDIASVPRYAALSRSIQADTGFPVLTGLFWPFDRYMAELKEAAADFHPSGWFRKEDRQDQ